MSLSETGPSVVEQAKKLAGSDEALERIYTSIRDSFMKPSLSAGILLAEYSGQEDPLLGAATQMVHMYQDRSLDGFPNLTRDECRIVAQAILDLAEEREAE